MRKISRGNGKNGGTNLRLGSANPRASLGAFSRVV